MWKNFTVLILLLITTLSAKAFEDCILSANENLTNIEIENPEIIKVYPLVTVMNEKNTIIVQPLQEGKTSFLVTKGGKEKITFDVLVNTHNTELSCVDGFEITTLDNPPEFLDCDIDLPPMLKEDTKIELPPGLRGMN